MTTNVASDVRYYGYRYMNARMGRWTGRDPIQECGGIAVLSVSRNDLVSRLDAVGLTCHIVVPFAHGSDLDVPGNQLLRKSVDWVRKLDETDTLIPFGCKTKQVRVLLVDRLLGETGQVDEQLSVMAKLAVILAGDTWTEDVTKANFRSLWNKAMADVNSRRDIMCSKEPWGGCCLNVWLTFDCQEGDKELDMIFQNISRERGIERFLDDLTGEETFCGKTWRWNCEGNYWELWRSTWGKPWEM
jgi:RHS repeat-associated protein